MLANCNLKLLLVSGQFSSISRYEKCHQEEVENNYYDSTRIQGDDTEEDRNQTLG